MPDIPKHECKPEAHGWTKRFIACEPRLSEAAELYRKSGFEVLLVPINSKTAADNCSEIRKEIECMECYRGAEDKYRIIYTKPEIQL